MNMVAQEEERPAITTSDIQIKSLYPILASNSLTSSSSSPPSPTFPSAPIDVGDMARRGSAMTDISLRLSEDAVGPNGIARLAPIDIAARPASDDAVIAPWVDVPPTPLPKSPGRTFSFGPKASVVSLVTPRNGSSGSNVYYRNGRPSESQSTLSIQDPNRNSIDEGDSQRAPFGSSSSSNSFELRKSKSSLNIGNLYQKLKGRPSKATLYASDGHSSDAIHPSLRNPVPPLPTPLISFSTDTLVGSSKISLPFKASATKTKKSDKKRHAHPPLPENSQVNLGLDLNKISNWDFSEMQGIVRLPSSGYLSSPSSGGVSDFGTYQQQQPALSSVNFNNPFASSSTVVPSQTPRKHSHHRISPTSVLPPDLASLDGRQSVASTANSGPTAQWVAPQSWVVQQEGEDAVEQAANYDSSEDEVNPPPAPPPKMSAATLVGGEEWSMVPSPELMGSVTSLGKTKRRRPTEGRASISPVYYRVRIYREGGGNHYASFEASATVGDLNTHLASKIFKDDVRGEYHRLYLDEGGRERLLGSSEKPASIVRKRLMLNGYEQEDGIELLGVEDQPFLFKFIFKTQLLGPPEEDLTFETFDFIDLTGRSLRTIPVALHQNADSIVSLKLSRNPMLEIPLDFIQSCSTLRELRLSNMAMHKVPQSVRHSTTLHRLDLSCNRISDLEEAYLDEIPGLMNLFLQNNKLTSLPWHAPRLRNLTTLNISNNRFSQFPKGICGMHSLQDLDLSFNAISQLPDEIGNLVNLQRLVLVGNQIARFPDECGQLVSLRILDCRRNSISDLTVVLMLPKIVEVWGDHNMISALDLSIGPNLTKLDVNHNDITKLSLIPGPVGRSPYSLTALDLSYAKLSSLDDIALGTLTSLRKLKLDHNSFRTIPDTLGELTFLEVLSCSDNQLDTLPQSIGRLQKLEVLDAHHNALTGLPASLWNCASLIKVNFTSNSIKQWPLPPFESDQGDGGSLYARKGSTASAATIPGLAPLVHSLEKLYLGENKLSDDEVHPLMIFKELRVLNLSFNDIQELPPDFLAQMTNIEQLYLSGNKLTNIPTEDLPRLKNLTTLYLNGNRLKTLPHELGKVKDLVILDVGSNLLRYNINNWEFDWNWNFNKKLKYLNLSGNKRLQIKADSSRSSGQHHRMSRDLSQMSRQTLAGFKDLTALRVLGLIDVTITTTGADTGVDIPDETDLRRVRTSQSTVNGMAYGVADSLGSTQLLNILDLVYEFPRGPGDPKRAIFAMFGRYSPPKGLLPLTSPNKVSKFLHDNFVNVFQTQLGTLNLSKGHTVSDALRRSFIKLNEKLFHYLRDQSVKQRKGSRASSTATSSSWMYDPALQRTGASGCVVYFVNKRMYVANVGNAMAVVSRQGEAHCLSKMHDPYDRAETHHIRAAGGWISTGGKVNEEVDVSRSFGHFNLVPTVNAKPHVSTWDVGPFDEFVIIANRGLWDFIPVQTAVDIARSAAAQDPMIAAQKLRDFAISYGADGSTMIMVVMLSESRLQQEYARQPVKRKDRDELTPALKDLSRFRPEIDPPTGHLALVFTDIRNSTHLWEVNPGMPTAMRLHNLLLRKYLRICGGYEVKTEGDAFMVSFPTALEAVWWCLAVQKALLEEAWPLEILECEDGKEEFDDRGTRIRRGLLVRMGIHSGYPVCEPDPITHRMDYFGSMVNRSARVNSAAGGQIAVTSDIVREINARVFETEAESEYSKAQPQMAVEGIKTIGVSVTSVGEMKLKGFEFTEHISHIYIKGLEAREKFKDTPSTTGQASRVQFSVPQTKELGLLCLRLEALSGGRLFRAFPDRKGSVQSVTNNPMDNLVADEGTESTNTVFMADPQLLLPPMTESCSDVDLMLILDSLSVRIENAIRGIADRICPPTVDRAKFMKALMDGGDLDPRTLDFVKSLLHKF